MEVAVSSPEIKIRKKPAPAASEKWTKEQYLKFRYLVWGDVLKLLPQKKPYTIGIADEIYHLIKHKYPGRYKKCRRAIGGFFSRKCKTPYYKSWLKKGKYRHGLNGRRVRIDRADLNEYLKKAA